MSVDAVVQMRGAKAVTRTEAESGPGPPGDCVSALNPALLSSVPS